MKQRYNTFSKIQELEQNNSGTPSKYSPCIALKEVAPSVVASFSIPNDPHFNYLLIQATKSFLKSWKHCGTPFNLLLTVNQYRALQAIKSMSEGKSIDVVIQEVANITSNSTSVTDIIYTLIKKGLLACNQVDETFVVSISKIGINYLRITPEPETYIQKNKTQHSDKRAEDNTYPGNAIIQMEGTAPDSNTTTSGGVHAKVEG